MSTGNPGLARLASATRKIGQEHNGNICLCETYIYEVTVQATHPVEHIHPALERDTLECCEHGQHKVVKVGYPKIWTLTTKVNFDFLAFCHLPIFPADLTLITLESTATRPAVSEHFSIFASFFCICSYLVFNLGSSWARLSVPLIKQVLCMAPMNISSPMMA